MCIIVHHLCVLVLSEIDGVEAVFILFNLSLISLVRNFNFCNKSAWGYRREEKFTHTRCRKMCMRVSVNSLVCACVSVCACVFLACSMCS